MDQPVDHQQCVGRVNAAWEHLGKFAEPVFHEFGNGLRMCHIGGERHDVGKIRVGGRQGGLNIGEHLGALRLEIADADDIAVLVRRQHAGEKQILRRREPAHVGVLPERSAQRLHVVNVDVRRHILVSL